uniref:Viral interleukin-10 homolog n=1 Tax=Human cytomegalovirus TaxID=10359 RepID=Q0QIF1_HCMV|nr:interleukin 10 [Human betaherpesvirus 5]ABD18498.1 interleukin 10 [Human betaherpesvirus 5]
MLSVMVSSSLVLIVFFLGASEEAKPAATTTTIKNTKPQCRPEDYASRLQDLRVTFHRVKPTLQREDDYSVWLDGTVVKGCWGCSVMDWLLRRYLEIVFPAGDHVYPGLKTELHSMRSTLESIYKDMRQCPLLGCGDKSVISRLSQEAERKSDNGTRKGLSELDTLFSRLEEYLHSRK